MNIAQLTDNTRFVNVLAEWNSKVALRNILKSVEKSIDKSLMLLGRKNQMSKQVVNNWVGSTTSEKDLHVVAEYKFNASANY